MFIEKFLSQEECTQILASVQDSRRVRNRWECTNFILPSSVKTKLCDLLDDTPVCALQIYNKGDSFDPHIDIGTGVWRTQSMSIVLNNGFKGGKFFCDGKHHLDIGDALLFKPTDLHWVTPVTDGRRYSLTVWGTR